MWGVFRKHRAQRRRCAASPKQREEMRPQIGRRVAERARSEAELTEGHLTPDLFRVTGFFLEPRDWLPHLEAGRIGCARQAVVKANRRAIIQGECMAKRLQSAVSLMALALCSCAQPQPPTTSRPIRTLEQLIAELPPGGTKTTVVYASIDLSCGGKTYTVKTGTDGGICTVDTYPNSKNNTATCSDGTKGGGGANCTDGCVQSEGAGSCSVKNSR
jgi:hypothetical protein